MELTVPKKENIFKTTWEDSLDLYYMPLIKHVYLYRFKLALALIEGRKYKTLLDIGFGCGIFLKELFLHTNSLYGIDVHNNVERVQETVKKEGFSADLRKGDIYSIPFPDNSLDCIMAMSILEHITELDKGLNEIYRVSSQGTDIILGFPVSNFITGAFFKALGYIPKEIHPSGHNDILEAIRRHFKIIKIMKFPGILPVSLWLYIVLKCQK